MLFQSHFSSQFESKGITFIRLPPVGYLKTFFVFAIFFFAGTGVFYWWAFPGFNSTLFTQNWHFAEGRIIVSELNKIPDAKKEGVFFSYPHVEYEYNVEDEQFIGKTISLWLADSGNLNESEKILAFYPKGKIVNVYYNPKNPVESTLKPESLNGSLIALLLSFACAIIGLYGLSVTLRDFITGRSRPSLIIFEL